MPTDLQSHGASRAPRTFEMRDTGWAEMEDPRRPRAPKWLLVPVILTTASIATLVLFAAWTARATQGLIDLRDREIQRVRRG